MSSNRNYRSTSAQLAFLRAASRPSTTPTQTETCVRCDEDVDRSYEVLDTPEGTYCALCVERMQAGGRQTW